ncbi:MAG: AAA domain-containing protein, partial [Desulfobacterales bacterium]|nr:AAA domain-containing protein [Desulfobacterales bacterium]
MSIIKHASGRRIVLVFDDFLGLYQAGATSGSNLSVAHVLKPYAARREVAILAEMTPGAFRALQELDRGFADLFHTISTRETTPDETLTILVRAMRTLEGRHGCTFHPGVLPLAVDLQRRYSRGLAFPGKAVVFLDDGRLTDALGGTADFTNTIIMTSNLGSREAGKSIGYTKAGKEATAAKYIRAAEAFFRPEFFNRLDRITPFGHLTKTEIEMICGRIIETIFRREGLSRRRCLLDIHPGVVAKAARDGYHPELGARALKREIERTIARPVAVHLAGFNPGKAAVIKIDRPDHGIRARASEPREAGKTSWPLLAMDGPGAMERMGRLEQFFQRAARELSPFRPGSGVNADNLLPEHEFYFEAVDQLNRLRNRFERSMDSPAGMTRPALPLDKQMKFRGRKKKRKYWKYGDPHISQKELMAVQRLSEYLVTIESVSEPIAAEQNEWTRMLFDASELNALI